MDVQSFQMMGSSSKGYTWTKLTDMLLALRLEPVCKIIPGDNLVGSTDEGNRDRFVKLVLE